MEYLTEYEDEQGQTQTRQFGDQFERARQHARRLSSKDHTLIVYVVAFDDEARHGAEAYAYGRRDSADGKMKHEPRGIPMRNMRDFDKL